MNNITAWLEDLDTGGGEPKKVQLRMDGSHLIIRIGGPRGEEMRIKASYLTEVLNECKAVPV